MTLDQLDLTLAGLKNHYARQDFSPTGLIEIILQGIESSMRAESFNPIWTRVLTRAEIEKYLVELKNKSPDQLPLYGVPFAIKDNIDLAGIPTTATCPEFSYTPSNSAFVIGELINAGAIPIGKTNMDQFATGLVGTRSPEPWGPCHNALNAEYISGGSSSGSALAVATGLVTFSLGTDTAGSGRVPASLNNIVGLKPTHGLLSTSGVVPACRSLDCVSIFALNVEDANAVFDVAARFDPADAYARKNRYGNSKRYFGSPRQTLRLGIPETSQLNFFGNRDAEQLFEQAVSLVAKKNFELITIDFAPFVEAAKLLYDGPWVAERYLAAHDLIDNRPESLLPVIRHIIEPGNIFSWLDDVPNNRPESLLPVIRHIIEPGKNISAVAAFSAQYRLKALRQQAERELEKVDAILTPTNGTIYTLADVEKDPVRLNSNLGYYTNFMNLLDCAAIALPAGFYANGVGFGVTLFHRAYADKQLLSMAALLRDVGSEAKQVAGAKAPCNFVSVVVCGAHLQGLPLNWQLTERGGVLLRKTTTSARYRMFALPGGPPFRPGLLRDENTGKKIQVEVWSLPVENFGSFVAEIPPPLGIGKVELEDGSWESGFICEPYALADAKDITDTGSWREYLQSANKLGK